MDFFDPGDWWPLDPRAGGDRHRRRDPENLDRLLAAELRITGIPTLALFAGGREVARQAGAMPARQIVDWASRALATT